MNSAYFSCLFQPNSADRVLPEPWSLEKKSMKMHKSELTGLLGTVRLPVEAERVNRGDLCEPASTSLGPAFAESCGGSRWPNHGWDFCHGWDSIRISSRWTCFSGPVPLGYVCSWAFSFRFEFVWFFFPGMPVLRRITLQSKLTVQQPDCVVGQIS